MFPKAPNQYQKERHGVNAVARVAADFNLIWRETPTGDVGIDGQLEYVDENGFTTGSIVAVQVKSGPSFFRTETSDAWIFYPDPKHVFYWERFPLPVILVLHNPEQHRSYWLDVRQHLRSPSGSKPGGIAIPKRHVLEESSPHQLFQNAGVSDIPFIHDLDGVLSVMISKIHDNAAFRMSYFDLFVGGLTNICWSLYFGIDLAMELAEHSLEEAGSEYGVGIGDLEHDFLFSFVRFLIGQQLADVDISDYLIDWEDRQLQSHFVTPLTSRGRQLVRLISQHEDALVANGRLAHGNGLRVAQEGFFEMVPISYIKRLPRIRAFQKLL